METVRGYLFTEDFKFTPGELAFDKGIIVSVKELKESELSNEEKDKYIIPGLVDIHSHGCVGHDTCDADPEGLKKMLAYQRENGIFTYFPTTMTFDEERLSKVCECISKVADEDETIGGVYLEGPFISYEKRGAQNPDYIALPDDAMIKRLNKVSGNRVRFVAIAPEREGAMDCIKSAKGEYKYTVAHTTADYDTAVNAFNAGATHVTHLYNAMPAYNHRAPGVIGAAMDDERVFAELITDGIHIHPAVVRNTFKTFGPSRIILISDSCEATGMEDGEYELGGQKVFKKGNRATLSDGTLAGSASNLHDCLREAIKMGVPKEWAVRAATANPAIEAGVFDKVGSFAVGKKAFYTYL
ncbi:MAG: N-acetylglucosamine-6-phosphate deacetylase [Lachnospiraceae bacterium]|nr:N-acetylglucosamine-6-phosphate deacetylase [Lachnospiraceae bacterium]